MPNYTVLTQAGRARLVRTENNTSRVVTTLADTATATRVSQALTEATSDIARAAVYYVLAVLDADHLDVHDWYYSDSDVDWEQLAAPTRRLSLRRRALNTFDTGAGETKTTRYGSPIGDLPGVRALHDAVTGQPESVRRAVRDELADAYRPYDTVPVLARAYDRKWHDYDDMFLANAALETLDDDALAKLSSHPGGNDPYLVGLLEQLGAADFTDAASTDDQGYLSVDVNAAQLHAWMRHRA